MIYYYRLVSMVTKFRRVSRDVMAARIIVLCGVRNEAEEAVEYRECNTGYCRQMAAPKSMKCTNGLLYE
jgi:hypothetical protein